MKKFLIVITGLLVSGTITLMGYNFVNKTGSENEKKETSQLKYDKPEEFIKYHFEIRTKAGKKHPAYKPNYLLRELQKA